MTARERVLCSLEHRQPDRMAVDFGGTCVTTAHVTIVGALREFYGLPRRTPEVLEVFTLTGVIDGELQTLMGSDCARATPRGTMFGIPRGETKPWVNLQGQEVLVPRDFAVTPDGKGGYYCYPEGDTSCAPSGHIPAGGYYFDAVQRPVEFDEDDLDPADNLEEFGLLDEDDLAYLKGRIDAAYETGRAVVLEAPGMGLGDAAIVPGCALKHPKGIRSIEEWYMAPLLYPEYCQDIFDRQMEIAIENLRRIQAVAEDKIDVVFTCGADLAHQENTFYSKETFREVFLPYYKKANRWIHENTRWKILKHNCGAIEPLIPELIEAGFDALNPVQCSARGMEPRHLKEAFGRDIAFWGGGVDTQQTLPFGTPEEVRAQVLERCAIFAKDGGYLFNTIHNIQPGTPVENIAAMLDAVREFNGEPPLRRAK